MNSSKLYFLWKMLIELRCPLCAANLHMYIFVCAREAKCKSQYFSSCLKASSNLVHGIILSVCLPKPWHKGTKIPVHSTLVVNKDRRG